jgi:hypothetical protein
VNKPGLKFPEVLVNIYWRYDYLLITDRKSVAFVKFNFEDREFSTGFEEPSGRDSEGAFIDWHEDGVIMASSSTGQWVKLFYAGAVDCSAPLESTLPMMEN